jgi:site-specific recombinase XerD
MNLAVAAEEFLACLQHEKGCSPLTITAYRSDLSQFLQFLGEQRVPATISNITTVVARQYVASVSRAGRKPATIARRLASLKSLFAYLHDCECIQANPLGRVSTPKLRRRIPNYLTPDECRRLLKATDENHFFDLSFRDRAILATLLYTGIRRAELLALRLTGVDLQTRTLTVRHGKGDRSRVVPLRDDLIALLRDWLELRPDYDHDLLFTNRIGQPLGKHGLQAAFRRAVKGAAIERRGVTIHTLRHTFASTLLQNGADLVSIQTLLGHTSLDTTAVYLHVQMDGLRETVEKNPMAAS